LTSHPTYKRAAKKGILRMPVHEDGAWHEIPITHIVPIWTKPKYAHYLSFHLVRDGINGTPIVFPVVAKGEDRVRIFMHAHNTEEDVKKLVNSIMEWAEEMLEIEASGDKNRVPSAAKPAFDLIGQEQEESNGADVTNGMKGMKLENGSDGMDGMKTSNGAISVH
jgi:8-amino-7-oxononanoate synthase